MISFIFNALFGCDSAVDIPRGGGEGTYLC